MLYVVITLFGFVCLFSQAYTMSLVYTVPLDNLLLVKYYSLYTFYSTFTSIIQICRVQCPTLCMKLFILYLKSAIEINNLIECPISESVLLEHCEIIILNSSAEMKIQLVLHWIDWRLALVHAAVRSGFLSSFIHRFVFVQVVIDYFNAYRVSLCCNWSQ